MVELTFEGAVEEANHGLLEMLRVVDVRQVTSIWYHMKLRVSRFVKRARSDNFIRTLSAKEVPIAEANEDGELRAIDQSIRGRERVIGVEKVLERHTIRRLQRAHLTEHEILVSAHGHLHILWVPLELRLGHPKELASALLLWCKLESPKRIDLVLALVDHFIYLMAWRHLVDCV